jgi:hypothetical protein
MDTVGGNGKWKMVGPLWRFPKKIKVESLYYRGIPALDGCPKARIGNNYLLSFIAALFIIAKIWKQP